MTMSHCRQWLLTCQDGFQQVEALHRLRPFLYRQVRQRMWDVERIAAQYILSVFKKALGMQPLSEGITASMDGLLGIISCEHMYQGPTHMAYLYF